VRIGSVPRYVENLAISPDGRAVAGVTMLQADGPAPRVVRVDVHSGRLWSAPVDRPRVGGEIVWLPGGRLVAFPRGETADARVYDATLRARGRIAAWPGNGVATVGATAYGPTRDGKLVRAMLPHGRVTVMRRLPGRSVNVIVGA
jgi:hypothetical protein